MGKMLTVDPCLIKVHPRAVHNARPCLAARIRLVVVGQVCVVEQRFMLKPEVG
jgi:hypothetical protein